MCLAYRAMGRKNPLDLTERAAQYVKYVGAFLSPKICYIVPEDGGTRFTPQNDRESLLYTLVRLKMWLIEVNETVWADL